MLAFSTSPGVRLIAVAAFSSTLFLSLLGLDNGANHILTNFASDGFMLRHKVIYRFRSMMRTLKLRVLIVLCLAMLACGSCSPRQPAPPRVDIGDELAFETIDAGKELSTRKGKGYPEQEPTYVVIWNSSDIVKVVDWISDNAVDRLQSLDYSKYVALAVFEGVKGADGYDVVIEHIGVRVSTLVIIAQFLTNAPGSAMPAISTSPYHLVKMTKDDHLSPEMKVEFYHYIHYRQVQ